MATRSKKYGPKPLILMKKENSIVVPDDTILSKIYFIRGQKVMLDRDLAKLYGVTTGNLNKAVSRNKNRFPMDFMFRLDDGEFQTLLFQNGIAKRGGSKVPPYAFTELGVAMLSSVLRSEKAVEVNIQVMRAFAQLRQILFDNTELRLEIAQIRKKTESNSKSIELVFKYLDELLDKKENPKPATRIGFKTE